MYPKILFFSSEFCPPCRKAEKMVKEINFSLFGAKLEVEKINIENEMKRAQQHGVQKVPTIIVGEHRISTIVDREQLVDVILQGIMSSIKLNGKEKPI